MTVSLHKLLSVAVSLLSQCATASIVSGAVVGVYSPFAKDDALEVSVDTVQPYAELLSRVGASWAFVCGTVGESVSLTVEERKEIAESWVKHGHHHGIKVMVHVGADSIKDARALAAHAEQIGADAVAAMPPTFFRPKTNAQLVAHLKLLFGTAPSLPAFYYHNPAATFVTLDMAEFIEMADKELPTFQGVKYSDKDMKPFEAMLNYRSPTRDGAAFDIIMGSGIDNLWQALELGGKGFIGNSHVFLDAPQILKLYRQGKVSEAEAIKNQISARQKVFVPYGKLPAGKAIMAMMGVDVGPPRSPNQAISEADATALRNELAATGFDFAMKRHVEL